MYNHFQLAYKYLQYYINSSNGKGHGTHSPFVFEFITKVLNDKSIYPEYEQVEQLRSKLLKDNTILQVEDFGAGSSLSKTSQRSISSIAKNAAKPKKLGQLLFRMVKHYQPSKILELGTSLGITSTYLALANKTANFTTLEGSIEIANTAKTNFEQIGLTNLNLITGNFDNTLPAILQYLPVIGFAFIDGNHRQEPTERYFRQILPSLTDESLIVFDDIHWSHEMEAAWETIKNHPAVRCTIDLFFIGIVSVNKSFFEKQHFNIRF
jgi:predicted O-methyltransferase YrrM